MSSLQAPGIRTAKAGDEPSIVEMMRALIVELGPHDKLEVLFSRMDEDVHLALSEPSIRFFVAEHEKRLLGLIRADILLNDPIFRLRDDRRCGYIDQMYVRPEARLFGLGQKLIGVAEGWFVSQNIRHVMLHAAPRATRLYARLSYQPNRQMFKTLF